MTTQSYLNFKTISGSETGYLLAIDADTNTLWVWDNPLSSSSTIMSWKPIAQINEHKPIFSAYKSGSTIYFSNNLGLFSFDGTSVVLVKQTANNPCPPNYTLNANNIDCETCPPSISYTT